VFLFYYCFILFYYYFHYYYYYFYCFVLLVLLLSLLLLLLLLFYYYFIARAIFWGNDYVFFLVCICLIVQDCVLGITLYFDGFIWIYCDSPGCIKARIWLCLMYDHVILCS